MKHVKWIFVVLLISSLTSFVEKDKPSKGLFVGDMAPDFTIKTLSENGSNTTLSSMRGQLVLVNFWASYDAKSRMQNILFNHAVSSSHNKIAMVSVSFDTYPSIFKETISNDRIVTPDCFVESQGKSSKLYKLYDLDKGFTSYLVDEHGIIIAKNISALELSSYLQKYRV